MSKNFEAAETLFDFADQLALVSSELLRYRIRNKTKLAAVQITQLEDLEIQLDRATADVRAAGVATLGQLAEEDRREVETATREAEAFLRKIRRVEKVFAVATAVLNLSLAVVAMNPKDILTAAKGVKTSLQGS